MQGDAHSACSDRRVARVLRYLAEDLTRRPNLADVSRIAGLEPTYFSKRFRVIVGISYATWSQRLRVHHARQLLGIADLSITAIAAAVGYMDVTTFERAFRRVEGTCPRAYRRLVFVSNTRGAESRTTGAETAPGDSPYFGENVLQN
jgi:AraC-like DNA-binding protein